MSNVPFHATVMGHRFYQATMPELVRELARLNKNLERILAVLELPKGGDSGAPVSGSAPGPTKDSP